MTTELVLLLCVFAFVTAGAIFGPKGPFKVLANSGPRLGARIEQQMATGRQFKVSSGGAPSATQLWIPPQGQAPDGRWK